jgi:hypothetical protein
LNAKRKTRAQLEAALQAEGAARIELQQLLDSRMANFKTALGEYEAARKAVDELKERLSLSEAENQRMRGYLARVQEDDVVREELVTVGEPDGEARLVSKRKPTVFHEPNGYREDGRAGCNTMAMAYDRDLSRPARKHWVTY